MVLGPLFGSLILSLQELRFFGFRVLGFRAFSLQESRVWVLEFRVSGFSVLRFRFRVLVPGIGHLLVAWPTPRRVDCRSSVFHPQKNPVPNISP